MIVSNPWKEDAKHEPTVLAYWLELARNPLRAGWFLRIRMEYPGGKVRGPAGLFSTEFEARRFLNRFYPRTIAEVPDRTAPETLEVLLSNSGVAA